MASAASAALRSQTFLGAGLPPPPTIPTPTAGVFSPAPVPTKPAGADVFNPNTASQESQILGQLDPGNAAYVGRKYAATAASDVGNLKTGLAGLGDYRFGGTGDALGSVTPVKDRTSSQVGERYQQEAWKALAQANASGMLSGRSASMAVGAAWHRLGVEERTVLNTYASRTTTHLQNLSDELSTLGYTLGGLYGQDAQYALDNPITTEPAEAAGASASTPELTQGPGTALPYGTGPVSMHQNANLPPYTWVGKSSPNLSSLASSWGVPQSQLQTKRMGDGRYQVQFVGGGRGWR